MTDTLCFQDFRSKKNFDVCVSNNIGNRHEQQDTVYMAVGDTEAFSVLCDGMGGMNSGQLAAVTARDAFVEFCQYYKNIDTDWMQDSIEAVDEIVYNLSDENGNRLACGTTLVSVYVEDERIQWVSAGDSRLYIVRGHDVVQITTDHNYYYDLDNKLKKNEISEEEYNREKIQGDQLISYLGLGGLQLIDSSKESLPLVKDDVVFLCTDGIYRSIEEDILKKILIAGNSAEKIGTDLINEIQKVSNPIQDNYTFIIIKKLF